MYPYPSGDLHIGHWYIDDADRRDRPLPPDARRERLLADRLRRVRPAGRERRDQERHQPARLDDAEHRQHARASSGRWARRSTGTPRSSPPTPSTTAGTSGSSCSSWRPAWPTARCRRSTGAPTTGRWRASRSRAPTATAGAAARRSRSATCAQWYLRITKLRRRAARLRGHRLAGADPDPCRRTGSAGREGARDRLRDRAVDAPRRRRGAARVHDPAGHAVRGDVHGPGAGAPAGRDADRARRRAEVEAYVAQAAAPRPRSSACRRTARRRASPIGADAINPVNGERIPILDRRLRAGRLRHRRDHGRARPTTSATSRSRRSSACRSGGSSRRPATRTATLADGAYIAHSAGRAAGQRGRVHRPGRPTRAGARSSARSRREGKGKAAVTYRLRDWLISRQRYWGTPIPVIYCDDATGSCRCPDEDLPVRLPDTVDYRGSGENPLNRDEAFLNVDVPDVRRPGPARDRHDGHVHRLVLVLVPLPVAGQGRRRRSTARSSSAGRPVDQYTGGAEHAVMHLLYARGSGRRRCATSASSTQDEPFKRLFNQGQILGADGERMSKSRGNVQDPDDLVAQLRRRHGPPVPDVHGAVGPGRAVEPDRHRRRPPLPEPGLDDRARSARARARRPGAAARCRPARTRRRPDRDPRRPPTGRCAT